MESNIYWLWLLSMGSLIFLMQAGFFLLEGGQVRSRDVSNVMMKMNGHMGLGILAFLMFGFAIKQYGWPFAALPNGWRLPWQFISSGEHSIAFYVSLMFALVSCAIPSGCFSGRMKFSAYLLFAALYVGVAYPIFAYILWNGPLARLGVQDYAGSLGVHAVGGIIGIVGAKFLGARKQITNAHDVPMMGFGAMLLMFCWFGFNLGSVPSYGNMAADLPLVAINTLAAIAGGIIGSLAGTWAQSGKSDPIVTPNGGLAGAVAICSGVHLVHPLFAAAIGIIAGAQIPYTARFVTRKLKVDDPCGVGPVHATPGLLGGLAAGLWAPMIPNGFHGYTVHVWAQFIGTATALAYALVASVVIFSIVKYTVGLRVSEEEEVRGLDVAEHGLASYPEFMAELERPEPLHVLSGIKVEQVMTEVSAVSPEDTLDAVQEIMFAREIFSLPVLDDDNELCGVISMSDIMKIARDERGNVRVAAVYTREVQSAFPDQTIHEVVERMRERHLANFPVVSRREEKKLLGMVTKGDIVLAYRRVAIGSSVAGD